MKQQLQTLFADIPETYERINHLLTFGLDILWRKKAADSLEIRQNERWLDCCTGTGETAVNLKRRAAASNPVFAIDFSLPMIMKARRKKEASKIHFSLAEAGELPFRKGAFHQVTLSFAARNINTGPGALNRIYSEINRILKPEGRFIQVETSQPRNPLIRMLFHFYIRLFVRRTGRFLSGSGKAYAYLAATIPEFYDAEALVPVFKNSGFSRVIIRRLFMGAAAIHIAIK